MNSLWCTPKTNVIHQLHLNKKTSQLNRQVIYVIEYSTGYMKQTKNQLSDRLSGSGSVWAADSLLPHLVRCTPLTLNQPRAILWLQLSSRVHHRC